MERKVATVVFVDLVDSTGLVAGADPEVVRQRVNNYFEQVARCIQTHGGTVEKFAGDAVMAAFGVPRAHEDDAERALRAALQILPAVEELGLRVRIGVEAGEVVVEDAESTFATGEAVNLAARLQQAAPEGAILIGPGVRRLANGRVVAEAADPVQIGGRAEPLPSWRLLEMAAQAGRALATAPFVGREVELQLLHNTYARVVRDRRAHLATLFGEPGIGKSRLVHEFVEGVERATVLRGRCLPFGEGVTYWALAEMVKQSAGITDDDPIAEAFDKLRSCCESDAIADLLAAAAGLRGASEREHKREELLWASRAWAEEFALMQPLILVFEDIHWAEEPMLNVIEHLASSVRDAPLLILCVTRPDLLELRPSWGGGNLRAAAIELAPLDAQESEQLADGLQPEGGLPADQRALVLEKAEGNPLFLEETVRMLAESDGAHNTIPDTIQALIAARVDALPAEQKQVLQHASVIGRIFWQGALGQLAPQLDVATLVDAIHDRGRAGVPLQARPDRRGCLRGPEQGDACRAARGVRTLVARSRRRRAARDPRVPSRPGRPTDRGARGKGARGTTARRGRRARGSREARVQPRGVSDGPQTAPPRAGARADTAPPLPCGARCLAHARHGDGGGRDRAGRAERDRATRRRRGRDARSPGRRARGRERQRPRSRGRARNAGLAGRD